jgi:hypothetical protein
MLETEKHLSRAELDAQLDNALEDGFPARDPVTIGEVSAAEPDRPLHRSPAVLDAERVNVLARNVKTAHEARPATPGQEAHLQRGTEITRTQSAPSPIGRKCQSGDAEQRALADAVSDLDSRD